MHLQFSQRYYLFHHVEIRKDTYLAAILGEGEHPVNSMHHQAVKEPAAALKPMAVSEDGLIEGMYLPEKRFIWGVQWHPEFAYEADENCKKIAEAFVDACEK